MRTFLDLPGASGASYRFRQWSADEPHQPIAGNYAVVRESAAGLEVLSLGSARDLSKATAAMAPEIRGSGRLVFTRLNVSRSLREQEHADLLGAHPAAASEMID